MEELRDAWRELNEVIEEIRQVEGYEAFMAAPTFDDVAAAAVDGQPLCYVAAAESEGFALLVREGGELEHVPLPELTGEAVRSAVSSLYTSYDEFSLDRTTGYAPWAADLEAVTRWLWDAAMRDILARADASPAVTLVPGGVLGMLPLHAAWTEDPGAPTGRQYAVDLAAISYAPNARALTEARRIAEELPGQGLLVLADPAPAPNYDPMPFTVLEKDAAVAALPHAPRALVGSEAVLSAVLRELPRADVVHFACHGYAVLDDPLESALILAEGERLRLRDLLRVDLRVRLAILSSCETSLPGRQLPDEVVSLPTGVLQAGAAGIVATQWAVDDMAACMVVTEFYRRWRHEGETPAEALRQAQRWVRDSTNAEKSALFTQAMEGGSAWPPSEVADVLLDHISLRAPEKRDEADLPAWAGFSYVGA